MQITKKMAPGAFDAHEACKTVQGHFAHDHDSTPEAALSALQISLETTTASAMQLFGGDPHASLISATAALKAIGAAIDSLTTIVGRAHE